MGRVAFVPEVIGSDTFTWEWTRNKKKLAEQFNRYNSVNYIQLQWNRKFHETGDFSLYMRAQDYDSKARFVLAENRPEVGIIQKVEYNSDITGDFVTLSGFFADKIMDFTVMANALNLDLQRGENWTLAGSNPSILPWEVLMDSTYITAIEKITALVVKSSWALPGWKKPWYYLDDSGYTTGKPYKRYASTVVDNSPFYDVGANRILGTGAAIIEESVEAGAHLGELVYKLLQKTECGISPVIEYSRDSLQLKLRFFSGRKYTKDVVFSRANGNTDYIKYSYDWSNAARRAVIMADIMDTVRVVHWKNPVDPDGTLVKPHRYAWEYTYLDDQTDPEGLPMHVSLYSSKVYTHPAINGWPDLYPEIYVNPQLDNPDKMKAAALCKDCDSAAKLELLNHMPETNVEIGALQVDGCRYLEDYDLGDTVTVRIDAIKEQFTQRIIEVRIPFR